MANASFFKRFSEAGLSVMVTAGAVADTRRAYKVTGLTSRVPQAAICGDNDLIFGFPNMRSASGEGVKLECDGIFEVVASGAYTAGTAFTAAAAGAVRTSVFNTDYDQGIFLTSGADGTVATVRFRGV